MLVHPNSSSVGARIGLSLQLNDNDGKGLSAQMNWRGEGGTIGPAKNGGCREWLMRRNRLSETVLHQSNFIYWDFLKSQFPGGRGRLQSKILLVRSDEPGIALG